MIFWQMIGCCIMENKRWRADKGEIFYYICADFCVKRRADQRDYFADHCYKDRNYFRTKKAAQKSAEEIIKVLKRANDELCDFQWGLMKMRQGKRVTRKAYRIQKEYEYDFWQMINGEIMQYWLTPEHFYEEFKCNYISIEKNCDFFATDWEIYGG